MLPEIDIRAVVKAPHGTEPLLPSRQRAAQVFDVQYLRGGHAIHGSAEVPDSPAVVRVDEVPQSGIEVPDALDDIARDHDGRARDVPSLEGQSRIYAPAEKLRSRCAEPGEPPCQP